MQKKGRIFSNTQENTYMSYPLSLLVNIFMM